MAVASARVVGVMAMICLGTPPFHSVSTSFFAPPIRESECARTAPQVVQWCVSPFLVDSNVAFP